ncbi:MAG: UbiA family prenyltransferase [Candidatus Aminicenantes bacterium]|nr:UbiA family prenyltransferase [Candidatus Aminicenantes bacterium]MDH5384472.1 UbiA family prenyltransferase [Candidatus Aminicenantes bacterium]MDH5743058.1 UbiA family prenyltransferase [Candidatus Aminicenantes bacterium]
MSPYLEAMRLGRWPRSLAIFSGVAAYFFLYRDSASTLPVLWGLGQSIFAFLLTWGISTANYVINEIADAPFDIHHPTKRNRPLARGEIKKIPFLIYGIFLSLLSLVLAYIFFSRPFFFSLLALLFAGFLYNIKPIRTKDIPFLDSISESANNPIRFLIGWFAFSPAHVLPPLSLLVSWWFFGNFLMVSKRLSEFRLLKDKAENYRSSLSKYSIPSLVLGIALSGTLFFASYFIFAFSFKLQSFIYFSPFVFFYLFLIFWKTLKEKEALEEPERLLKHPKFAIYTVILVLLFSLSYFIDTIGQ